MRRSGTGLQICALGSTELSRGSRQSTPGPLLQDPEDKAEVKGHSAHPCPGGCLPLGLCPCTECPGSSLWVSVPAPVLVVAGGLTERTSHLHWLGLWDREQEAGCPPQA